MWELFNLRTDPYELVNLYNDTKASNPSFLQELDGITTRYYTCSGQSCHNVAP